MVRAYLDLTASGLKGIDIGDGWTLGSITAQLPVSAKSCQSAWPDISPEARAFL